MSIYVSDVNSTLVCILSFRKRCIVCPSKSGKVTYTKLWLYWWGGIKKMRAVQYFSFNWEWLPVTVTSKHRGTQSWGGILIVPSYWQRRVSALLTNSLRGCGCLPGFHFTALHLHERLHCIMSSLLHGYMALWVCIAAERPASNVVICQPPPQCLTINYIFIFFALFAAVAIFTFRALSIEKCISGISP